MSKMNNDMSVFSQGEPIAVESWVPSMTLRMLLLHCAEENPESEDIILDLFQDSYEPEIDPPVEANSVLSADIGPFFGPFLPILPIAFD